MSAQSQADLLIRGGRIFRGRFLPDAEALAVRHGRVLAAGRLSDLDTLVGPGTRIVDLGGRFACPGIVDPHLHLLPLGLTLEEIDAQPAKLVSVEAICAAVRARAASLPPGRWIVARGYDHHQLAERRHPERDDLDKAAPDHPVWLIRSCGHLAVANGRALALAGIGADTPDPPGGRIGRRDGGLTGLLHETARDLVRRVLPASSDADLVDAVERAGRLCLSHGITAVTDAAVGARAGWREIEAYRAARDAGRLPVRANLALVAGANGIAARAAESGWVTGAGCDRLSIGPAKLFADGSAGARTAALSAGYLSDPGQRGMLYLSGEAMTAEVGRHHRLGFQVAIHAVGDLAIEQVLDAYEAALGGCPEPGRRHRIEHATFATAGQTARMARLDVAAVPQPVFLHDYGRMYLAHVGPVRAAAAFPMRDWLEAGLAPAASTDCPIAGLSPLRNLGSMRDRRTVDGVAIGRDQRLTPEEALTACTESGAWVNRRESLHGRLEPGMAADLAVFSHDLIGPDPAACDPDTCRCEMTILDGETVYGS